MEACLQGEQLHAFNPGDLLTSFVQCHNKIIDFDYDFEDDDPQVVDTEPLPDMTISNGFTNQYTENMESTQNSWLYD